MVLYNIFIIGNIRFNLDTNKLNDDVTLNFKTMMIKKISYI